MSDLQRFPPNSPTLGVMLHITPQSCQTPSQTYAEFTELVQAIENLGYDEAWVTEHHFTPHSLTPAPLMMMGHFLAHTQTLKLGAAAVLLGFHNPIEIAEQLTTLNTLYPKRLMCGFAKGGPFESQNTAFKADAGLSRARMEEAIPAILHLLSSPFVSHAGTYYQWDKVDLHPVSSVDAKQFLLASSHPSTLQLAAKYGMGLMAAQFWDSQKIADNVAYYQQCHATNYAPDMMAARGLFIDDDPQVARDKALHHIQSFRAQKSQLWGQHQGPMHRLDDEQLLSRMLCGTVPQVIQQVENLLSIGVTRLGLNPLTSHHHCRLNQLERFCVDVWPEVQQNLAREATQEGPSL